ncbi:MAG: nitrous oxide reductase family maturation protein NosD [Planctomycetota bacterium]
MTAKVTLRLVPFVLAFLTGTVGAREFDLQAAIDAAAPGDIVRVPAGVHHGHFVVRRAITLQGAAGAIVDGGGDGDVLRIEVGGVTVRGLTIRGTGTSLDRENAAITVLAGPVTLEENVLEDVLFGIYLKQSPGSIIRNNRIGGKDLDVARRGDGIRLWYSPDSLVEGNTVLGSRDVVMWFSSGVRLLNNHVSSGRYGLHFMYSNGNWLEGNLLEDNSVGSFLMYSKDLTVKGNTLRNNRGPSGYGVGLKDMDGVDMQDNLFVGNRVGLFLDSSPGSVRVQHFITKNVFAYNDIGVSFLPSVKRNHFSDNTFLDNLEQIAVLGGGSFLGNEFTVDGVGNFWSDYRGYDLDGDGIGDVPYRSESLFENLMDRTPELRLFLFSPAQQAIEAAANAFPIMRPRVKLIDEAPLMASREVNAPLPPEPPRSKMVLAAGLLLLMPAVVLAGILRRSSRAARDGIMERRVASMNEAEPMLRIEGLSKRFGSFKALDDVSFSVRSGEAVALWGENGAGKTTAIKCVLGLHPCQGRITVAGCDAVRRGKEARRALGYVPQELALYDDLTARDALSFYARLRRLPQARVAAVLEQARLTGHGAKRVAALSGGMKQRLALAAALLSDPPLLILDEMTSSLDTGARAELLDLLLELKERGQTILFTSHRLDEVEQLADRVLVLDGGRVLLECSPHELGGRLKLTSTLRLFIVGDRLEEAADALRENGYEPRINGVSILVDVLPGEKARPLELLVAASIKVRDFELEGERGART